MVPRSEAPLVSIGVPVRNGAATLVNALESVIHQTYDNLEIIISDNMSTDGTAEICLAYAARDPRIRYVRQNDDLTFAGNFAFLRDQAVGRYFMWAAHDDTRDLDFVERLVAALESNPRAVLAMGDTIEILDGKSRILATDFAVAGPGRSARLREAALNHCAHIYGLWRLAALRRIIIRYGGWWPDTPMMMAGTCLGDYLHVPGTCFRYQFNAHPFLPARDASDGAGLGRLVRLARRGRDLPELVFLSARAVTSVAGPFWGGVAGIFAAEKIFHQIVGYLARRRAR